jgi:hypothetical protein
MADMKRLYRFAPKLVSSIVAVAVCHHRILGERIGMR